jgi:hypothetical protein
MSGANDTEQVFAGDDVPVSRGGVGAAVAVHVHSVLNPGDADDGILLDQTLGDSVGTAFRRHMTGHLSVQRFADDKRTLAKRSGAERSDRRSYGYRQVLLEGTPSGTREPELVATYHDDRSLSTASCPSAGVISTALVCPRAASPSASRMADSASGPRDIQSLLYRGHAMRHAPCVRRRRRPRPASPLRARSGR